MAVAPDKIGKDGETVRPDIQTKFDKIDALLKDPLYVLNTNKHPEKDAGGLLFVFEFEGMLNDTELDTLNQGWDGWDVHQGQNDSTKPRDSVSLRTWSLRLVKNP